MAKSSKGQSSKGQSSKGQPSKGQPSKGKRTYRDLDYPALQAQNSQQRAQLSLEQRRHLQQQGYKNVGWEKVIALAERLEQLRMPGEFADWSLDELFLEAERVGDRYQTPDEIARHRDQMAVETAAIEALIEQQFPDPDPEVIDFAHRPSRPAASGTIRRSHPS
jgi:hypothetical protein